jgi:hypothetical protein
MTTPAPTSGEDRCRLSELRAAVDSVDRAVCEANVPPARPGIPWNRGDRHGQEP